jgi:hypothetical protein
MGRGMGKAQSAAVRSPGRKEQVVFNDGAVLIATSNANGEIELSGIGARGKAYHSHCCNENAARQIVAMLRDAAEVIEQGKPAHLQNGVSRDGSSGAYSDMLDVEVIVEHTGPSYATIRLMGPRGGFNGGGVFTIKFADEFRQAAQAIEAAL